MEMESTIRRVREGLLGRYFSNKSELRHIAEDVGFAFVPVEFLSTDDEKALVSLHLKGLGEVRVRGERPAPWQPFHITAVEPA